MNEPRPFRLNYRHPLAKGLVAFGIEDGELEKPDPAMVELVAELEQAEAVVDKLPTYADTGKPFIPDKDGAWVIDSYWPATEPHPAPVVRTYWNHGTAQWAFDIQTPLGPSGVRMVYGPAYSTREAALALAAQKETT